MFTNKLRAKSILAGLLAAITLVGTPMAVYAGYAPSNRATFTCIAPDNCPGANYVTFNSFTNAQNYGDERSFLDAKDASDTSANGYKDTVAVHDGQKLTMRVYIHNNANPNAIGVDAATAKDTKLQVQLPSSVKTSNTAAANISASNANPGTVSDTVNFNGSSAFSLKFYQNDPVQMTYRPNGAGDYVTHTIPGASFSNDYTMNANFGDWHGCFNYAALVTMTVVVSMPTTPPVTPAYSCDAFNIVADVNRTVKVSSFSTTQTNGAVFKNASVNWGDNTAALTDSNIIGKTHQYAADGTYTVTATANFTVNGQDKTAGGANCVKQVTFSSTKPPVVTPPTTTPPTATPATLVNTGAGSVMSLFAAATAAGTVAYRRMLSRRLGQQ